MMNEYHRINYQNALMSYNQNIFNQYYSQQVQIAQQFVYNNNPNLQQQHFAYNNNPNFKQH